MTNKSDVTMAMVLTMLQALERRVSAVERKAGVTPEPAPSPPAPDDETAAIHSWMRTALEGLGGCASGDVGTMQKGLRVFPRSIDGARASVLLREIAAGKHPGCGMTAVVVGRGSVGNSGTYSKWRLDLISRTSQPEASPTIAPPATIHEYVDGPVTEAVRAHGGAVEWTAREIMSLVPGCPQPHGRGLGSFLGHLHAKQKTTQSGLRVEEGHQEEGRPGDKRAAVYALSVRISK